MTRPMPEIDTAAIRARAQAAHNEVAGLADGSREWRMHVPVQPERDSDTVISASLADVDVLLAALAGATEVGAQEAAKHLRPMFELAVATLRQVLGSFTQRGSRGNGMTTWADVSPALLAQWQRALLALNAGESFYRGARPPTADVEQLRREFDAMLPVVWAAREAAAAMTFSATPAVARLIAAVAELDGPGSGARIDVGATDAVPEGAAEGQPAMGGLSVVHAARFVRQMNTITALQGPSAEQFEALRDAALAAGGVVVRPLIELSTSGLLWLINATVFHPRGWALALHNRGGEITGWHLQGDGREVWVFEGNHDERFAAAQATLTPKPLGIPEFSPQDRLDLIELLTGARIGIDDVTTMIAAMGHRLFWSDKPDPFWLERGAFIGVRRMAHELQAKLNGFIPPRRDSFLLSLFGSHVLRAAVVLVEHDRNTWPECDHVAH